MTTYRIEENKAYGSKEIYFSGKPAQEVREALKNMKFRWNGKKVCWYGFANEYDLISALNGCTPEEEKTETFVVTSGYMGGGAYYGAKETYLTGADLKKEIIKDIKNATGVKITGRTGKSTYTDSFRFTIQITDAECLDFFDEYLPLYNDAKMLSEIYKMNHIWVNVNGNDEYITEKDWLESDEKRRDEIREAYALYCYRYETSNINIYHIDSNLALTEAFKKVLHKINSIIKSYNHDESNSMVDYFDVGFYYDINLKYVQA